MRRQGRLGWSSPGHATQPQLGQRIRILTGKGTRFPQTPHLVVPFTNNVAFRSLLTPAGWGAVTGSARGINGGPRRTRRLEAAARCFWKPKWPWVKTKPAKPAKPPKPSTTGRAVCNARFLLREVHVSGALSGACTGKGPQIANPRPTPKPGNLGPPWPPGTSGDPAGYSRGRPLGGSRLSLVRSGSPGADAARL